MNGLKALLVLAALALPSTVFAQIIFNGSDRAGGIQNQNDVDSCQTSGGGSRIKRNCERESRAARSEVLLPSIKLGPLVTAQCEAIATTEYFQQGASAHVQSSLHVSDCTAASGTLTFALRTRDDNGTIAPLEFDETWQRTDDQDVKLDAVYPIGENVLLTSVRVRNLRCTCDDAAVEQANADPPPEPAGTDAPGAQAKE